jgi:hypothetical protein
LYEIRPTSTAQETAGAVESFIIYLSAAYRLLQNLVGTICPHCSNRMGHYADERDGAIVPRRGRSDGFSYKTVTSASKNRGAGTEQLATGSCWCCRGGVVVGFDR